MPDMTTASYVSTKRQRFRQLHEAGCFLLPNPWDIGGVKRLERLGFKAIASTSAGLAWSLGREDGHVTRDEVIEHLRVLSASTELPVNADFEAGYAHDLKGLEESVRLAAESGISGLSIEDWDGSRIYDFKEAVERLHATRAALDRHAPDVILVGRCERHLREPHADLGETLRRLVAYSEAGADCLYAPLITDMGAIREVVKAVAPKPVNVLMRPELRVSDLAAAGVRRVSTGGSLARAAWNGFENFARTLLEQGTAA